MKVLSKYTTEYIQWISNYIQGLQKVMHIVIFLGFSGMITSSSAIVLGNMVETVNEGMCVCWNGCWGVGGQVKVTREKVKIIFWLVLGFSGLDEIFTFQCGSRWCGCGGLWGRGCQVGGFGAMVLELYFSFGDCFVWRWVVCSNWCILGVAGVGYVSWVKSEMSMSLILSLVLTSKIS